MFSKAKNRYYAARRGFMNNSWSFCERRNTDFWPLSIFRFLEEEKLIVVDFIDLGPFFGFETIFDRFF